MFPVSAVFKSTSNCHTQWPQSNFNPWFKQMNLRRGERKPASHLSLCSPIFFTQRLFTQKLLLHRLFNQKLFLHILFTHILFTHRLFTQKLFLQILFTHIFSPIDSLPRNSSCTYFSPIYVSPRDSSPGNPSCTYF